MSKEAEDLPIAGVLPSTEDIKNGWGGYARECWGYLQTLSYTNRYFGSNEYATLSFIGDGEMLDSSGTQYNYIDYNSDSAWGVEGCRDECIKQFRYHDIEDGLVGFTATPLTWTCRCRVDAALIDVSSPCTDYGTTSCNLGLGGTGIVSSLQPSPFGPNYDSGYAWIGRSNELQISQYVGSNTLLWMGNGRCVSSTGAEYKSLTYSKTSEWRIDECREQCTGKFVAYNIEKSLVGFYTYDPDTPNKDCVCLAASGSYAPGGYNSPSTECSAYDATSCDLNPSTSGPVSGVDIVTADQRNSDYEYLRFCYAWQGLNPYTHRSLHEADRHHRDAGATAAVDEPSKASPPMTIASTSLESNLRGQKSVRQVQEDSRKLQTIPEGANPASIRGEGVATIAFGHRAYRKNLVTGEEGWHFLKEGTRKMQVSSAGSFGVEITIYRADYSFLFPDASAATTRGTALGLLAATLGFVMALCLCLL